MAALKLKLSVVMFCPNEMHGRFRRRETPRRPRARLHAPVDFPGGRKVAVRIHVAGGIDIRNGIDHGVRDLAAAGAVEKCEFKAVAGALQSRKILPAAQSNALAVYGHYSRS